eukprot:s155_g28.t1
MRGSWRSTRMQCESLKKWATSRRTEAPRVTLASRRSTENASSRERSFQVHETRFLGLLECGEVHNSGRGASAAKALHFWNVLISSSRSLIVQGE